MPDEDKGITIPAWAWKAAVPFLILALGGGGTLGQYVGILLPAQEKHAAVREEKANVDNDNAWFQQNLTACLAQLAAHSEASHE